MRRLILAGIALGVIFGLAPKDTRAQDWKRVAMSRQLDESGPVNVLVRYGAGEFTVRPIENANLLYRVDLEYDSEKFAPVEEYRPGRLTLGTETRRDRHRLRGDIEGGEMLLELSDRVPLDLEMEFGAVRAEIDLGGLRIHDLAVTTGASESRLRVSSPNPERARRASFKVGAASFVARELGNLNVDEFEIEAGVGDVQLDFTGEWTESAEAHVKMGLGSLELRLPRGLGVRLEKSTFLASLDSQGLVKRGDAYYSLDYDEADVRLTIEIDAAFGSIDVVWVR